MAPVKFLFFAAVASGSVLGALGSDENVADAEVVTNECVDALNLARAGKLDIRQKLLQKDSDPQGLDKAAQDMIKNGVVIVGKGQAKSSTAPSSGLKDHPVGQCGAVAGLMPSLEVGTGKKTKIHGLVAKFPASVELTREKCAELIQTQIIEGLNAIKKGNQQAIYAAEGSATPNEPYKESTAAQNFAYMMYSNATTAGCAIAKGCSSGENVLLCKFKESVDTDSKNPPFSQEFFDAVDARNEADVSITTLKPDDINTPLTSSAKLLSAVAAFGVALFSLIPF